MAQGVSVPLLKYARENRFSVRSAGYEGRKMRTHNLHTQKPIMKTTTTQTTAGAATTAQFKKTPILRHGGQVAHISRERAADLRRAGRSRSGDNVRFHQRGCIGTTILIKDCNHSISLAR